MGYQGTWEGVRGRLRRRRGNSSPGVCGKKSGKKKSEVLGTARKRVAGIFERRDSKKKYLTSTKPGRERNRGAGSRSDITDARRKPRPEKKCHRVSGKKRTAKALGGKR